MTTFTLFLAVTLAVLAVLYRIRGRVTDPARTALRNTTGHDALQAARELAGRDQGTVFLGLRADTQAWLTASRQQSVLVLGPPRSGKTSTVICPSILIAPGPVVSTSTKLDVLHATA